MTREWREPSADDARTFDPADVFEAGLRNHHISNTAYPIAHERTWGPYRVSRESSAEVARRAWEGIDDLCLYVHVPFCETRCMYCEYTVVRREELSAAAAYVDDLLAEFDLYREALGTARRTLHGFDIGGGTPAFLPGDEIARIVEKARGSFRFAPGAGISIETTPKIAAADPSRLAAYRRLGIDRLSMGVQVTDPDLLRVLNRAENGAACHRRAVENARAAGFRRLNLDLMYGFAGQTLESWDATLRHAIALDPEAITLYRMRYKLTRVSHHADAVTLGHVRPMIRLAKTRLLEAGYYANPGKTTYSRIPGEAGTSAYIARRVVDGMPYLGLGLGAQSFTHTTISYNDGAARKNLAPYRRSVAARRLPLQDLYDLPARQVMAKMCAVSFYFGEIDRRAFRAKFGVGLEEAFAGEVEFVLAKGLMEWTNRALRLTAEGALSVNGVIALFHAPSVQRYLLERDPAAAEDMHRHRKFAVAVAGDRASAFSAAGPVDSPDGTAACPLDPHDPERARRVEGTRSLGAPLPGALHLPEAAEDPAHV
jgi:oxygen-independent coproporphyrinogen-3 oxidase